MATFWQIKDRVRAHLGEFDIPDWQLTQALDHGRKEIENRVNAYWMRKGPIDVNYTIAQQRYNIVTDLGITDFKDLRLTMNKELSQNVYEEVPTDLDFEQTELLYATDDTGLPEVAVLDDDDMVFYPIPDAADDMRIFYWAYTANPTSNVSSAADPLIDRFPDALVYAADMYGAREVLRDFAKAQAWEEQLAQEIVAIEQASKLRAFPSRITFIPKQGRWTRNSKRRNIFIWV